MGIVLHWFLPANGDSRTDLSLGNAGGSRAAGNGGERAPDIRLPGRQAGEGLMSVLRRRGLLSTPTDDN
jgi:hypothetical protein